MRFLCLHGYATCVDVLKEMMEPIMEHLPSSWQYEYLEAAELDQVPPPNFSWHNYPYSEDVQDALHRLKSFIDSEGPFDGLWGFSQGAAMATLLLLEHQRTHPHALDWPFKMVIYNSTFLPYRLDSGSVTWHKVEKDQLEATYQRGAFDASGGKMYIDWRRDQRTMLDYHMLKRVQDKITFPTQLLLKYRPQDVPNKLNVPSVHVRGVKDDYFFVDDSVFELFNPATATRMTHRGGHHFPRFPDELVHFAELIIETAATLV